MSDTPERLRVFPDYCADGVWDDEGAVAPHELPISDELAARLTAWNRFWEERRVDFSDWDSPESEKHFIGEGRAICDALTRELPWNYTVVPAFEN